MVEIAINNFDVLKEFEEKLIAFRNRSVDDGIVRHSLLNYLEDILKKVNVHIHFSYEVVRKSYFNVLFLICRGKWFWNSTTPHQMVQRSGVFYHIVTTVRREHLMQHLSILPKFCRK